MTVCTICFLGWKLLVTLVKRMLACLAVISACALQTTCQPGFVEAAAKALKEEESAAVTQKSELSSVSQDHQATLPVMPKWEMYD